jgi:hypothetical protein
VITDGIREFVARDWQRVRDSKDAYWGRRVAELGAAEALRVADELRRQACQMDPHWPDTESRQADLASHVRVTALLRRAGATRRR